jgi:hypothetical protein
MIEDRKLTAKEERKWRAEFKTIETGAYAGAPATLEAIRRTLEYAGVEVTNGAPGVRMGKRRPHHGLTDHARSLAEEHSHKGVSRSCVVPMCLWESRTRSLFLSVATKSVFAHGDYNLPVRH